MIPGNKKLLKTSITEVRSLTEADLQSLREKSVGSARIANLKDSHHMVARYMALGLSLGEVAESTGYSYARIAVLSTDPAVQQLVSKYREIVTDRVFDAAAELTKLSVANMAKIERMKSDRLDSADEEGGSPIPFKELITAGADYMDRFGPIKKSATHNTNVNIDFAANLEAAIARSRKVSSQ